MLGNYKALPIEDFSGGLKTRGGIYYRPDLGTTTPNCNAVISSNGKILERMNGYTQISTGDAKAGTGNGAFNYAVDSSTNKLMAHFGTVIYKMDAYDGTLDTLQSTGVSDARSEWDVFTTAAGVNTLLQTTHNNDTMHSWAGVAATMSNVTAAPLVKYLKVWKNYVWVAGHTATPNRLQYCTLNDFATWPAGNTDDNFGTPEGDIITGMDLLRGRLVILKGFNIFVVSYLGGTPLFEITHVTSGVGCVASHTITLITALVASQGTTEPQDILVFMGSDKRWYGFDGIVAFPIDEAISEDNNESPISMPTLSGAYLAKCHAVNHRRKHRVIMFVPNLAATAPSHGLHYDYYTGGIWPEKSQDMEASALVKDATTNLVPVALKDGHVYELDRGDSYAGSSIDSYYDTELLDLRQSFGLHKGGQFEIHTRLRGQTSLIVQRRNDWDGSFSDSKTLTITGGDRLGQTFVLGTSRLGGPRGGSMIYPYPYLTNAAQLRISSNDTNAGFRIYKIDYIAQTLGVGKAH